MANARSKKEGASARSPRGTFRRPPTVTKPELLTDGSDEEFRSLIQNLLVLGHHLQQLRSRLARRLGVSEPQYRILLTVVQLQGREGVSVGTVAARLRLTGAFVTREAGKLVRRRYLRKGANPDDGRGVHLSLTPEGEQAFREFAPVAQVINDEVFRDLSRREFELLGRIIKNLVKGGERALAVDDVMQVAGVPERSGASGGQRAGKKSAKSAAAETHTPR